VHENGAAAAGRGGKSIERGIPHTTGIHRVVVDRKKGKKGEKKRFNLLPPAHQKSHLFFNCGIKGHYPNDRLLVQNVHTTFWQRSDKKRKKGKVVTTGITGSQ
jgi:hypothetical protein